MSDPDRIVGGKIRVVNYINSELQTAFIM